MKVFVSGGMGFVGSHVVDELVADGCEVLVLDYLHPLAHAAEPDYLNPGARYVRGDLRDAELVKRCVEGVDAVSHQAAMVGIGSDFDDVTAYVEHNSLATATLLRELWRARFSGRFVLASSMVIYGEGGYRCPEHGAVTPGPRAAELLAAGRFEPPCPGCGSELEPIPVVEGAQPDPRSVYAATKLEQEQLCFAYGREAGVAVTALRYHNVYGPRMPRDTPYAGVMSLFRSALESGEPPRVFEDGAQLRDFVHVGDIARANVLALRPDSSVPGAFNIASGRPRSVGAIAAELAEALRGPAPRVTGEYRLGDVRHVFASTDRARELLGFEARVDTASGIAEFATASLRDPVPEASIAGKVP